MALALYQSYAAIAVDFLVIFFCWIRLESVQSLPLYCWSGSEWAGGMGPRKRTEELFFFFFSFLQLVELDTYIDGATGVAVKDGNQG